MCHPEEHSDLLTVLLSPAEAGSFNSKERNHRIH